MLNVYFYENHDCINSLKVHFLTWGLGFLHDFSLAPVAETNNGFGPEKIEN